ALYFYREPKYEHEADIQADQLNTGQSQDKSAHDITAGRSMQNQGLPSAIEAAVKGHAGNVLDDPIKDQFEETFARDLSAVRIHADVKSNTLARNIGATAFTCGQHIFFNQNAFQPGTQAGQRLLAHELTHVMQQTHHSQIQKAELESQTAMSVDEDVLLALQIAVDMMNGGNWWESQLFPAPWQEALNQLMVTVARGSTQYAGREAQVVFQEAILCLEEAIPYVDDQWLDTHYFPKVTAWQKKFREEELRLGVENTYEQFVNNELPSMDDYPGQAAYLAAKMDELYRTVDVVDQVKKISNFKLARKGASLVDWYDTFGRTESYATPKSFWTGNAVIAYSTDRGAMVKDGITRAKGILMGIDAVFKTPKMLSAEPIYEDNTFADVATRVKWGIEFISGVSALVAETGNVVLTAIAPFVKDKALRFAILGHADDCIEKSRSLSKSLGLTGALAALDLAKNMAIIVDANSTSFERIDAGVGATVATLKLMEVGVKYGARPGSLLARHGLQFGAMEGSMATVGGVALAPLAISISLNWMLFKDVLLPLMGSTRINVTAVLMHDEVEDMIEQVNAIGRSYAKVIIAQSMKNNTEDAEKIEMYQSIENAAAKEVAYMIYEFNLHHINSWRSRTLKREFQQIILEHKDALEDQFATPETIAPIVAALVYKAEMCTVFIQYLVADEAGLSGPQEIDRLIAEKNQGETVP
ncbi:DUF4157 domain-containing protein, partial [bacterium]|nr:DUF4157 domain-containing protein [bacterium]